jgi:hypothetical protein
MSKKWDKAYTEASTMGVIGRKLGFASLKGSKTSEAHDKLVDDIDNLVDTQIEIEKRNAEKQYDKGWNHGMITGSCAAVLGMFIGLIWAGKEASKNEIPKD